MRLVAQWPHITGSRTLLRGSFGSSPPQAPPLRPYAGRCEPLAVAQRRGLGCLWQPEEGRTRTKRVVPDKRPRASPPRARPTLDSVLKPLGERRAVSRCQRGRANSVVWIDAGGVGGSCGAVSPLLGARAGRLTVAVS